jgi:hypothetical protein
VTLLASRLACQSSVFRFNTLNSDVFAGADKSTRDPRPGKDRELEEFALNF